MGKNELGLILHGADRLRNVLLRQREELRNSRRRGQSTVAEIRTTFLRGCQGDLVALCAGVVRAGGNLQVRTPQGLKRWARGLDFILQVLAGR